MLYAPSGLYPTILEKKKLFFLAVGLVDSHRLFLREF